MAETCIVCLLELATSIPDHANVLHPSTTKPDLDDATAVASQSLQHNVDGAPLIKQASIHTQQLVAHLLPCGHYLHDDCLKPWVERANSCPICRASFNQVELSATIGGEVLSSYAVQDKQQVADIDATMYMDDDLFDEAEQWSQPCSVCGDCGNDDQLLLCDGCEGSCHTYCIGLEDVPSGPWYCHTCMEEHRANSLRRAQRMGRTVGARRRTGRAQRPSAWTRVWQEVWGRLNIDLDFPFDEDGEDARTAAQQREFQEWQRRFRVAQRQGGRNRFTDNAATLLDGRAGQPSIQVPVGESQDELRAWNAFDKARESLDGPSSNGRKRKSATSSPTEPDPEPERKLKRPRTRRAQDVPDTTSLTNAGPSRTARRSPKRRSPTPVAQSPQPRAAPTFFQSLLREVEDAPSGSENGPASNSLHPSHNSPRGYASPDVSSPEASPRISTSPSPRPVSTTPPPFTVARPASPTPLTSMISPIYLPHASFSPFSPAAGSLGTSSPDAPDISNTSPGRPRHSSRLPSARCSGRRPSDDSPTRASLSYSAKAEIQKMVSAALKPLYRNQAINKDQYTDINRDISRMMYDKVGDATGLTEQNERDKWQRVAAEEVEKAVQALKDREGVEVLKGNEVTAVAS